MRLMYLRVKDGNSLFKDTEISFAPEWEFSIRDGSIRCRRIEQFEMPAKFYSVGRYSPVQAVNIAAGKNGCGKTTIARVLKEIFSGSKTDFSYVLICKGFLFLDQNTAKSGNATEKWLVYSCTGEDVEYRYAEIGSSDEYEAELKEYNYLPFPIQEQVDLVYYSPHFTTENPFRGTSGRMINLSSSGLFVESPLSTYARIQLRDGVDADIAIDRFAYDERRRIIEFASAFYKTDEDARKNVPFPMPIKASLDSDDESTARIRRYFYDKAKEIKSENGDGSDAAYAGIERMCEKIRSIIEYGGTNYLIASIIIGYVAAYCSDCNLLGSYRQGRFAAEYGVALVEACGDRFVELLNTKTDKEQDIFLIDYFCRSLVDIRKRIMSSSQSRTDYGEHERSALRLFLRLRKLVKRCPPEYNIGIEKYTVVEIADVTSFRLFQDVVKWHRLAMIFSTFIKINFAPRLSSGEVSYLTMYGRLASHFVYGGSVASSDKPKRDAVGFVDEAETTLHPVWQKNLLWNVLWFFENFARNFNVHLIFATHSPMLLSDVPLSHCIMMERWGTGRDARTVCSDLKTKKSSLGLTSTFAANIFDLYRSSFFMDDGLVGKFAQKKLDALMVKAKHIIEGASDQEMDEKDWRVLESVGDPIAKRYFASLKRLIKAL